MPNYDVSVIIPQRNEPRLRETVERVAETAQCECEIIVVNDGAQDVPTTVQRLARVVTPWDKPVGLQMCRDYGIGHAQAETVVLLDAHMQFRDGSGWLEMLVDWSMSHDNGIGCAICEGVCADRWQMAFDCDHCKEQADNLERLGAKRPAPPSLRYGARLLWTEKSLAQTGREEYKIFPSKWHDRPGSAPGIVQSVLGGCYVMSRAWYLHGLCRPWRGMRAWGTSEQTLSIVNWLCGGFCECLPVAVGHWFRKPDQVPYSSASGEPGGYEHQIGIWFNRWRLLYVLPMADSLRSELLDWLAENHVRSGIESKVRKWLCMDDQSYKLKDHLSRQKRRMEDYRREWGL